MNFFGSLGGVSEGIFKSLNCDRKSGDNENNIEINRKIVCNSFEGENRLFTVKQIHSDKIFILKTEEDLIKSDLVECDGIITNLPNVLLGISTADCAPILFHEPSSNTIAACHAGWRGASSDLLQNILQKMEEIYNCEVKNINIWLGPMIQQKNYQVQQDFFNKWVEKSSDFEQFFISGNNNDYYFDLPGVIKYKMKNLGIIKNNIYDNEIDTFSNHEYFSYRRAIYNKEIYTGDTFFGRNISVIGI
jgi:YfiH family protein